MSDSTNLNSPDLVLAQSRGLQPAKKTKDAEPLIVTSNSEEVQSQENNPNSEDSDSKRKAATDEPAKVGSVNCMFMLFSGAMGAGVLGLPTVVRHNGYLPGLMLLTMGGIFSAISEWEYYFVFVKIVIGI